MINLGLSRITALVSQLPTKQTWKAIHIAGTNGKGSVASYLSSLFLRLSRPSNSDAELKVGRFTSPHLIDRWDCITINDQPVSESLFLRVEREVQSYATNVDETNKSKAKSSGDKGNGNVTEFELLTATAFEIFSQQNCQVAIIECGLGGRLDATNVLKPEHVACSIITKIGLDHMGMLGDTLEAIAREKAEIVKKDVPMVVDGTNPFNAIEAIAVIANSRNIAPTLSRAPDIEYEWNIRPFDGVGQMPPHQYNNLILALTAFTKSQPHLPALKFTQPTELDLPGILTDVQTSYPARLQHLSIAKLYPQYTKPILLDGAHNPQSAEVLRSYIDSLSAKPTGFFKSRLTTKLCKPRTWILAMSRGKEATQILTTLLEKHDHVIACHFSRVDGMPWVSPMSPASLAQTAQALVDPGNVSVAADVLHALQIATEQCGEKSGDTAANPDKGEIEIVVAGSLYLASDLLRAMRDGPGAVKERFEIGVAI